MGMMLKNLVHPYIQSTTVLCDILSAVTLRECNLDLRVRASGLDLRVRALCRRHATRMQLTCALGCSRLHARVKYQRREDKQRDKRDRLLTTLRKMSRVMASFMCLREAFLRIRIIIMAAKTRIHLIKQ